MGSLLGDSPKTTQIALRAPERESKLKR